MKVLIIVPFILTILSAVKSQQRREDWWQNGNFYQIYPRSFMDSNGDGIGDLRGIIERLEYLKGIGMDGVWLSPIFKSPMADFGYDISDYKAIQSDYGSATDLVNLINEAHKIELRIILDFVPNHTSDEHEWFQRSVNNETKYRDFYVWHNGVYNASTKKHDPPSNWVSLFRNSAWEWNDKRQQYYLHQFAIKQPDLNYRNPAVLRAMDDVLNYWLKKGIDGFRIDAVPYFYEVEVNKHTGTYPDEPVIKNVSDCPDPEDWCHLEHIYTKDQPGNIETIYHWRELVDNFKRKHNTNTKILMTEAFTNFDDLMRMYGDGKNNGSHIPFNFELLTELNNQSTAYDFKNYADHWLNNMPKGVFANWVLGNHDNNRWATRFGPQRTDLINIYLQTLPGIAVTYYGEEYGMEDVFVPWNETVDIQACTSSPETFEKYSRDPERTPLRWDSSANAGFSTAKKTWLPVGEGYEKNNVAVQLRSKRSHLKNFIRLTNLRKTENAFDDGKFESKVAGNVLLYTRKANFGDSFLMILNIGDKDVKLNLPKHFPEVGNKVQVELCSIQSKLKEGSLVTSTTFTAQAYLGYVLRLPKTEIDWISRFQDFFNTLFSKIL